MDETATLPSAGSSRFRFYGFANGISARQAAHPEVKVSLGGIGSKDNHIRRRHRPCEGLGPMNQKGEWSKGPQDQK